MSLKLFRDARHHLAQLMGLEPTALDEHKCTIVEEAHCTECGADCSSMTEPTNSEKVMFAILDLPMIDCEAELHHEDEEFVEDAINELLSRLPFKAAERVLERIQSKDGGRSYRTYETRRFAYSDDAFNGDEE